MPGSLEPSELLCSARRKLEELNYILLIEDLSWNESVCHWILHCRFSIEVSSKFIPHQTDWFVLIEENYPFGDVKFYPSKENSIDVTFQHQLFNSIGHVNNHWRNGKICISTPLFCFGRREYDIEPVSAEEKLIWHFQRMHDWLILAAKGQLVKSGDPFDIPVFPNENLSLAVIHSENVLSNDLWNKIKDISGIVLIHKLQDNENKLLIKEFRNYKNERLQSSEFGSLLECFSDEINIGLWIKLPVIPVNQPWQIPETWEDLFNICKTKKFDIKSYLKKGFQHIRNGKPHILLLGFAIPEFLGEKSKIFYWKPVALPILSHGKLNGFRDNEESIFNRDISNLINKEKNIQWMKSENWNNEQILVRGQYDCIVKSKKFILIGGGAIGSMIAEIMIRSGVENLIIIDGDTVNIGNLVRHTLTVSELDLYKSQSLLKRLSTINPNVQITAINKKFSNLNKDEENLIRDSSVIIDCTSDDSLLNELELFNWSEEKVFISISSGLFGRKLFLYLCKSLNFPSADFHRELYPWLKSEKEEFSDYEFPMDGIGCWHPVFPARSDDFWLLSSCASKVIESELKKGVSEKKLIIFEQEFKDNDFIGIKRVQ